MKNNKELIISIVVIVVIAGIIYFVLPKSQNTAPAIKTETPVAQAEVKPETVTVQIVDGKFVPDAVTLKPLDTIMWVNMDETAHSIVSDNGTLLKSKKLLKGESFGFTSATAGTVSYHCGIHSSMKGKFTISSKQ